jgi:serine/threonine protein kinase
MEALAAGDPARIGPYRLVAQLGRGGMGRVYLGRLEATGRAVAVKTIHGELLADPEFRARFAHEVAAARRVRDEYIAEVVDADPHGPTPWLATAYVPGISVEDAVRRFGPLPADSVRILGVCVARAVSAIHAVQLVHRDLKPGNVLLTAAGPKVIDFGIARGVAEAGMTRTGMVSGSPPYMAPEQLTRGGYGPGSDVFSLAAILHYAATAAGPYGRGGPQEQYARALAVGPVLDPALPDGLIELIGRCFTTDPNSRPTAAQIAEALEAHPGERPTPGWLPSSVMTEILTQATDALNKDSAAGQGTRPVGGTPGIARPSVPPQPPMQPPPLQPRPQQGPPRPVPARASSPKAQPPLVPPPAVQPGSQKPPSFAPPHVPPPSHTPQRNNVPPPGPYQNAPRPSMPYPNAPRLKDSFPNASYPGYPARPLPYGYQPAPPDNMAAVTALVLALVGIIAPILLPVALPFGIVGMSRARRTGVGYGQALTGVIVSSLLILGWLIVIIVVANRSG